MAIDSGAVGAGFSPYDVNHDGMISGLDALLIINQLNAHGAQSVVAAAPSASMASTAGTGSAPLAQLDVNQDGLVSGLDALQVINQLNAARGPLPAGDTTQSRVTVNQAQSANATVELQITDLAGNALTQTGVGGEFLVNMYVTDLRGGLGSNGGIFSAYAQISFNPNVVELIPDDATTEINPPGHVEVNELINDNVDGVTFDDDDPFTFSSTYLGSRAADLITNTSSMVTYEIGATDGTAPLGTSHRLLVATIRMRVLNTATTGQSTLISSSAATEPGHLFLGYGQSTPLTDVSYGSATLNVVDLPGVRIGDPSPAPEGSNGFATGFVFPITLSRPSSQPITVNFTTVNGTANTSDYVPNTTSITFPPNQTSTFITINSVADNTPEPDESFFATIALPASSQQNAVLLRARARAIIISDDAPVITKYDVRGAEGNSGTTPFQFPFTLSGNLSGVGSVTVNYTTRNGEAIAGQDYVATSGSFQFIPGGQNGQLTQVVVVQVIGNTVNEPDKRFFLDLSYLDPAGSGRTITQTAIATIVDDDLAPILPTLSIGAPTPGTVSPGGQLVFPVSLSGANFTFPITVQYDTVSGTAEEGEDFIGQHGTLTFTSAATQTITVTTLVEDPFDPDDINVDEQFSVVLSSPTNATISISTAIGTIDNPPVSVISTQSASVVEGDSGVRTLVFNVTLNRVDNNPVTIDFATIAGTATPGAAPGPGIDYMNVSGTLIFPGGSPGVFTQQVLVPVFGDTLFETNETLLLNLTNPTNAFLPPSSATVTGTILDDDQPPLVTVDDVSVLEGITNPTFTVKLSGPSSLPVTVNFATGGGTATPGLDYQSVSGTLVFLPGELEKTITVVVFHDNIDESPETFFLNLSNIQGGRLGRAAAMATITDVPTSILGGFVYADVNANGVRDAADVGLFNIGVRVTGTNIFGESVNQTLLTVPNGQYQFGHLFPGVYTISEIRPLDLSDGPDTVGTLGETGPHVANQFTVQIVLGASMQGLNYNFAEIGTYQQLIPHLADDIFFAH